MTTLRQTGWATVALLATAIAGRAAEGGAPAPAPAAVQAPAAKPAPVRTIQAEAIGADKTKAILVYSHPLLPSEGARWIAFGRYVEYAGKKAASEIRGSRYDIVHRTVFDRVGQMIFELEPGRYEVALYTSADLDRQTSQTARFDLAAGDIKTYSVRRTEYQAPTRSRSGTTTSGADGPEP